MTDQSPLGANQIESTTTILTKQRENLKKYVEADGRAKDSVDILGSLLDILASPFYEVVAEEIVTEFEGDPADVQTDVADDGDPDNEFAVTKPAEPVEPADEPADEADNDGKSPTPSVP